jgi:NitT/TauT family transport system permease protein
MTVLTGERARKQPWKQVWDLIARWYSIPLLLLVWQVSVGSGLVESRLLPGPGKVWDALVSDVADGTLPYHAGVTLYRALAGFLLAALIGVPFAAAMARSNTVRNLFEPIFFFGYPVPKIALFPVFTYVFGFGTPSKIAFTFLECLYPIVVTCYFGFRGVQTRLIWSAQNFGADNVTILRRVILPAAMPSIFSGLRIALPVAIIVVVITEMIGDSVGLGYYITIWSTRFTFTNVYAAIIVIGICGLVLDQALLLLRHRVVYWQRERW